MAKGKSACIMHSFHFWEWTNDKRLSFDDRQTNLLCTVNYCQWEEFTQIEMPILYVIGIESTEVFVKYSDDGKYKQTILLHVQFKWRHHFRKTNHSQSIICWLKNWIILTFRLSLTFCSMNICSFGKWIYSSI